MAKSKGKSKVVEGEIRRIQRLFRLINLVRGNEQWSAKSLAAKLEIGPRMLYRDLNLLKDAGYPIIYDKEDQTYALAGDLFMPPVELTFEEALALTALANSVGGKGQIPYVEEASKAFEKIRAQLPLKVKQELRELDTHLHIRLGSTSDGSSERNVYTQMRNAITDGRALVCEYEALHGAGPGGAFTFYPYALFYEQRAWYVVGKHSKRGELRTLKLGRFTSVKVSAETYRVPASFSLDKHLGLAWRMIRGAERFEVELRIDPPVAEMLAETQWHSTQDVEHNDDDTLTFRYTVDGLDEIVYWILGLGPAVKVIKPDILAHRVRDLAQRIASRYA